MYIKFDAARYASLFRLDCKKLICPFLQIKKTIYFQRISASQCYIQEIENLINVYLSHKIAEFLSVVMNYAGYIWNLFSEFQFHICNSLNYGLGCAVQTHILKVHVLPHKDIWWLYLSSQCMDTNLVFIVLYPGIPWCKTH